MTSRDLQKTKYTDVKIVNFTNVLLPAHAQEAQFSKTPRPDTSQKPAEIGMALPPQRSRVFSIGSDAGSLQGDETPPHDRERVRQSIWSTISSYGGYYYYALNFAPASTVIVLIQTLLFFGGDFLFGIGSEEDVRVSWEKVIEDREYRRLFLAHLCHFTWYHLIFNAIGLIQIGRYMERKIQMLCTIVIIQSMGVGANLLYCITTKSLDYSTSTSTHGFSHVFYGLRMFVAYCQEPRNYEPGLFLGLYPAYLSSTWAPWQPALEIFLLKLIVSEMNVCGHWSGFITGFIFAFLILLVPDSIHRRRSRHLLHDTQPPPE